MIRNVLALEVGYDTSWQPAHKQFPLIFDDVICIYHLEIWYVYKVNC